MMKTRRIKTGQKRKNVFCTSVKHTLGKYLDQVQSKDVMHMGHHKLARCIHVTRLTQLLPLLTRGVFHLLKTKSRKFG